MTAIAFITAVALAASLAHSAPRAVSLDFCADQYLIAIANRDQIAAVSPGADRDDSYMRKEAHGLHVARPTAEEIAPLKPALVFRFWGGAPRLSQTLEKYGAKVITLDYITDFDGVRKNIRTVAKALDRKAAGEALIADLDARLAALARRKGPHPAALYVTPGGVTAGAGTMLDAIIKAAGARNAAGGIAGWPSLPMERIVRDPPDLIVTGFFGAATETVNHWSASRHPVFAKLFRKTPTVALPADIISCAAWYSVEASEDIARAADKAEEENLDAE